MATNLDDIKSFLFWKALLTEFFSTFILLLTSIGATVQGWNSDKHDVLQISLAVGLSVATIVWIFGHISGAHINPAVTMAMLVTKRISLLKALMYMVSQCAGAITGAKLIQVLTPDSITGVLGITSLGKEMTPAMGFGVEFLLTMFLMLTVFASCDTNRSDLGGSFPLTIGLFNIMSNLWAAEYSGASMNPARSLGPAVVMNIWTNHWIYWSGPLSGGIVGGLLYDNVLASTASLRKTSEPVIVLKI